MLPFASGPVCWIAAAAAALSVQMFALDHGASGCPAGPVVLGELRSEKVLCSCARMLLSSRLDGRDCACSVPCKNAWLSHHQPITLVLACPAPKILLGHWHTLIGSSITLTDILSMHKVCDSDCCSYLLD